MEPGQRELSITAGHGLQREGMQRAKSAVDFSNLLNPDASGERDRDKPQSDEDNCGKDMASVAVIRPNGPVPSGQQQPVDGSGELPRPYKCPLCDKAFHRLEHQTRHIRTHTGEKPHVCQFPGCSKKFSRSDELTRHTRIHNNPSSRRLTKQQHHNLVHGLQQEMMPPPPAPKAIRSAPPSAMSSPNVSPPHSYATYAIPPAAALNHYNRGLASAAQAPVMEMTMLARAVNQVAERETLTAPPHHHISVRHHHPYYPHNLHSTRGHLPSLSAYHMSRSHSHDEHDDHYGTSYRHAKKSRPNSPNSTAPSSPTFSQDSLSPTPDQTPLATPAHSPRLRPYVDTYDLPPFRSLSLHHTTPALAPLEPQPEGYLQATQPPTAGHRSTGISLSDILCRSDASQRKLPVPQAPKGTVHDLLGPSDGIHVSGRSSSSNSISGGDFLERL